MTDCLFCKIVAKEIPASIVFESEEILCFKDIDPKAPVHILVIPKVHFEDVKDLALKNQDLAGLLLAIAAKVAVQENLDKGFRIVFNTGSDAGQSVQHVHAHLLGGRSLTWPPG